MSENNNEKKNEIIISKDKVKKVFKVLLVIAVSFIMGFFSCFYGLTKTKTEETGEFEILPDNVTIITRQIEKALESSSSLITAKHTYQAVGIYENAKEFIGIKVPFTKNKVVYVYGGVVKAGIDLSAVTFDVLDAEKKIIINLPAVYIDSSEIDENSFEYPYENYSALNKPDMSDYVDLINILEENKKNEMLNNAEFISQTRTNTKTVLESFIRASELTEEYEIVFK